MAGDWIKADCATPNKPEIEKMARILNMEDPDLILGKLWRFWAWVDTTTKNGELETSARHIDRVVYCPGFTDALVAVGWLQETESGYSIPKFERHNGNTAKARSLEAEAKRLRREGEVEDPRPKEVNKCPTNVRQMSDKCPTKNAPNVRPEKRREEKEKHTTPILTDESSMQKEKPPCPTNPPPDVRQRPKDTAEVRALMAGQPLRPRDDDGLSVCSSKFFDELEAVGWRNKNGIPLADWRPLARQYAATWARNEAAAMTAKPQKKSRRDALWTD